MNPDDNDENDKSFFNGHERNFFEDRKENERKISIPPPVDNIFLEGEFAFHSSLVLLSLTDYSFKTLL